MPCLKSSAKRNQHRTAFSGDSIGIYLQKKGIVGDWKNHFSFEDREFTESILADHGISLTEWDS
jgi:hypothetical protein